MLRWTLGVALLGLIISPERYDLFSHTAYCQL
jgi:hypothetical protein